MPDTKTCDYSIKQDSWAKTNFSVCSKQFLAYLSNKQSIDLQQIGDFRSDQVHVLHTMKFIAHVLTQNFVAVRSKKT